MIRQDKMNRFPNMIDIVFKLIISMNLNQILEKIKRLILKRSINFVAFGVIVTIVVLWIHSFTPFSVKGGYFIQIIISLIMFYSLYEFFKRRKSEE